VQLIHVTLVEPVYRARRAHTSSPSFSSHFPVVAPSNQSFSLLFTHLLQLFAPANSSSKLCLLIDQIILYCCNCCLCFQLASSYLAINTLSFYWKTVRAAQLNSPVPLTFVIFIWQTKLKKETSKFTTVLPTKWLPTTIPSHSRANHSTYCDPKPNWKRKHQSSLLSYRQNGCQLPFQATPGQTIQLLATTIARTWHHTHFIPSRRLCMLGVCWSIRSLHSAPIPHWISFTLEIFHWWHWCPVE